jgi:hypothetical protein
MPWTCGDYLRCYHFCYRTAQNDVIPNNTHTLTASRIHQQNKTIWNLPRLGDTASNPFQDRCLKLLGHPSKPLKWGKPAGRTGKGGLQAFC